MTEPLPPQPTEVEAIPLSKFDEILLDNFAKDVTAQATRMEDLAKQLIALNIAIPGLYATVLKFVHGEKAIMTNHRWLIMTLIAWLLSLGLAFVGLFPVRYKAAADSLGDLQRYFYHSARRKFWWVAMAGLCSFLGMGLAIYSLLA